MLVLALDTSAHLCSACLYDDDRHAVLGERVEDIGRGHAERLMAVIDAALTEAGVELRAVERVGVTVGPGSFTGLRVGVATARGLALALKIPAIGVTTLEAIAAGARREPLDERPVLVLLDARRGELYGQLFAPDGGPLSPPLAMTPAAAAYVATLNHAVLIGSGSPLVAAFLAPSGLETVSLGAVSAPAIGDVARLAAAREPAGKPVPLYLRSPDAKPQTGFALPRQA